MRAVRLVRAACSALNLAAFEWSIASGLLRCGSAVGELVVDAPHTRVNGYQDAQAGFQPIEQNAKALYNSREPAQMAGEPGMPLGGGGFHPERLEPSHG